MNGHRAAREIAPGLAHSQPRAKAGLSRRSFVAGTLSVALPPAIRSSSRQAGDATPAASPTPTKRLQIVREQRPTYGEEPRRGGVLRLLRPALGRTDFTPVAFRQDFQVLVSYLDPLVRPDEVTMEPRPWLAERWEWSEDGRVITYILRTDVEWHDGSPLTADDVQFSFTVYRDDLDSGVRNLFAPMEAIEAIDDRTVRVKLNAPDGTWLFNASSQLIFQAAQHAGYWSSRPAGERTLTGFDSAGKLPTGTGPWRVVAWTDGGIEFERNERYWAGAPWFDRMLVNGEPDANERLAAWRSREVDLVWPIPSNDVERVENEPGRLVVADAASVMFAAFNFANPWRPEPGLFGDVRVRRALSLAIDRERYARDVFGTFIRERAAGTVAQPWANDRELTNPRRDLDEARNLLAEAGWQDLDGDGILDDPYGQRFAVTVIVRNDARAELPEVLRSIRRDLGDVGVELAVEELPEDRFVERWLTSRDFDLIAFAYDLYPGFSDFDLYGSAWDVRINPQGFNPGGYANKEVDEAIREALRATDVAKQRDALIRLQREVDEDLFGLWLGFPRELVLLAPDVLGFQPNKVWQTADTRKLWRSGEQVAPPTPVR